MFDLVISFVVGATIFASIGASCYGAGVVFARSLDLPLEQASDHFMVVLAGMVILFMMAAATALGYGILFQ